MQKHPLNCYYTITKFKHHHYVKQALLDHIQIADNQSPYFPLADVNISRCDWHLATDFNRQWFKFCQKLLLEQVLDIYKNLGYDGFTLQEIWFQQYQKMASHGWHTHSSNFTSVYYLELPEDSPKTKIVSPYDQQTIMDIAVDEGDILLFPSFVIHQGPINNSDNRKTIISFNTNATYSDTAQQKKLGVN